MTPNLIFQPMAVLLLLTVLVAFWAMFARVTAMKTSRVAPQKGQDAYKLREHLPHEANRIANNYNHLFEQPVLFYVACFALFLTDNITNFTIICAWAYVAVRVGHTLVQTLWDRVMARFAMFVLSWLPLTALIISLLTAIF